MNTTTRLDPAPYTRETVDRIRKGALPQDLGWMTAFYDSVCRKHGIESAPRLIAPQPRVIPKPAAIIWDAKSSELTRGAAKIALSPQIAAIFTAVHQQFLIDPDVVIPGAALQATSGCKSHGGMAAAILKFNERAAALKLQIRGRCIRPSGYRLIDLCSVASVSVNNPKQED